MKLREYWSIVVLVLVIAAIVWYLYSQPHLLAVFRSVSLLAIIYLVGMQMLFLATNGLFLREFASKFEVALTAKEWFGLSVVTTMGNYITPFSGGMIARAVYLKRRYEFPYTQFATLLASNYLVNFWVIGVIGVLTFLTFGRAVWSYWQLFVLFAAVVISISAFILFPAVRLPGENRMAKTLNTSLVGWELVKNDRVLLAKLVAYTLVNVFLNALGFWVAYGALGSPVPFRSALLIGMLTSFSLLIRITPGNLGIQEAVVSLSSGLLGIGTGQGLLVSLLIRVATMIPTFTLGPVFSFLLTRKLAISQEASPAAPDERPQ
jgi:uncharacterized membrane protein YbhN (UPF0104 family)